MSVTFVLNYCFTTVAVWRPMFEKVISNDHYRDKTIHKWQNDTIYIGAHNIALTLVP